MTENAIKRLSEKIHSYPNICIIFSYLWTGAANAQDPALPAAVSNVIPAERNGQISRINLEEDHEFFLAIAVILFGSFVLFLQYSVLKKNNDVSSDTIFRIFTVTLVIIGTLALITLGYSETQIAPALGLFGSIIGYLLGKSSNQHDLSAKTYGSKIRDLPEKERE